MREVVLDTETTGFDPKTGDRMVEIGAVELFNHMPTGRTYHQYINPERDVPEGAFQVHGLSQEFLRDYPVFKDVADAFLDFIGDAKLVIHNASFDVPFLNAELGWCNRPRIPMEQAVDTLLIARKKYPGAGNSLDALCRRFGIDNSHRTLHGALLDSEILAEVYLELIGGRQPGLVLGALESSTNDADPQETWRPRPRPEPLPSRLTPEEQAAHAAFVEALGDKALWSNSV
ncbi:DNA polymerase III subunit epsilon [Maritimibacter sp. UBA3975]|uniref:DNA polymerase III subunit epsilon n=1 Tax=Maritimibacter sp. UBA3975 TaxID=1946833 RepID=UPI000C0B4A1C|nr:DNA polymerase III subunit epsilon [Maritimibacter sp. UBA3975]MAM63444.1 DNA polymerase III subunit epsilon [Maritimibacter sp.]|tara:strand:- start:33218 stop:33910 length:693 start_codon:yes stop_codon:yes gene_type:complete